MKHVILHALPPTSHFVSLLACSHTTGQKNSPFLWDHTAYYQVYKTQSLDPTFWTSSIHSTLYPRIHYKKSPSWPYSLTFFTHMLKEFIIEALCTTCPISHVLNLTLIMLAPSYVLFILPISSLSWTQMLN